MSEAVEAELVQCAICQHSQNLTQIRFGERDLWLCPNCHDFAKGVVNRAGSAIQRLIFRKLGLLSE